MMCVD